MTIKEVMLAGNVTVAGESTQVLVSAKWTFEVLKGERMVRCTEKRDVGDSYDFPFEQIRFIRRTKEAKGA